MGGFILPTSSFFKNIVIDTPEDVKRFIEALEESEKFVRKYKFANREVNICDVEKEDIKELFKEL